MLIPSPETTFRDEELVYVDLENRAVLGPVQWDVQGTPQRLPKEREEQGKHQRKNSYPYCTFRAAQHFIHKRRSDGQRLMLLLDEAMDRAQRDPFWD